MSRRARAACFGLVALLCAAASARIASGYRERVDAQLGATRDVVVVTKALPAGRPLRARDVRGRLERRRVPVRFLPPDALLSPSEALGRRPVATIPAGSYLLASQLRTGTRRPAPQPAIGKRRHPVSIAVTGASALARGPGASRVDVVVTGEPVTGGRARARVAAAGVRLLALERASTDRAGPGGDSWTATLALRRSQALRLIEAESFAREVRLIPAAGAGRGGP